MYFLMLVFKISLNLGLDNSHKQGGFSKNLSKKSLKLVLNKESSTIAFNLNFILLPAEVNLVLEKKSRKKNAYMACSFSCVKKILTLLAEVVKVHMQASIV